ncbi:MAG TPA: glycosyltransferase [candidate division Zixibacteria bacterium]|nr:glycosyltransferase [candidate division Zixibacteria bacterium]
MRLMLAGDIRPVHLRRYAEYFRKQGHDVAVVSAEKASDYAPDYPLKAFNTPGAIKYPMTILSFKKAVADFKPDLLNCHYVPNYGLLGAMSGFHPLAISIWGSDILISAEKSKFHHARAGLIMRKADLLLTDAEMLSEAARKIIGVKKKIITVPFGVKQGLLERGLGRIIEKRDKLKLISTRQMVPVTRVGDFLEALRLLRGKVNFEAALIGAGPLYDNLKQKCSESDLDNVVFYGALPHEELLDRLFDFDIYVSCSRSDSTSVSLLEAMASGLFPIVSDIGGNREWIRHGVNGLMFEVGNGLHLAEMIMQAAGDFELRKKAAHRNFEIIQEKAIWEDNMAVVEKEFESLAAKS